MGDIKYDNPLLNHFEILKQLAEYFGFETILNVSHQITEAGYGCFLEQAINANNIKGLRNLFSQFIS